ncbi:MAG: efflux RND transporter periplasmic adaptor subunit [Planctomycetes bacterium]|nr:efflux RND transporter periplasmic adaptor subunit [Planctomycetota bacterium]
MKSAILTGVVFLALISAFAWTAWGGRLPWAAPPAHGEDWCEAHQVELSRCEKCNPKLARGGTMVTKIREPKTGECPNTLVRVTLGAGVAEQIGLARHVIEARPVAETVRANAETAFVPSSWARVAPRLPGIVREVPVSLGQTVEAGAILAIVEAPELAGAKSACLQAASARDLRQELYNKVNGLFEKHLATGRDELQARTDVEEARLVLEAAVLRLRALGLTEEQVAALQKDRDSSSRLPVTAPFAGTVVAASAVLGESASIDRPLFEIASLDRMWVEIDATEADLTRLEPGQRTVFFMEAFPGKKFTGKVMAIGGSVDDVTRTVKVYAEVKSPDGLLRAHMFGRVEITVKTAEPKLLVPREAVQSDGDCALVFVEASAGSFQARKIETGGIYEAGFEVKGGLAAGEVVVTTGSFLLKTEVMKGEMGAG